MISLLLIIFLALTVFFVVKLIKNTGDLDEGPFFAYIAAIIVFGVLSLIFFFWELALIGAIETSFTIDEKIAMYEEENASIEKRIDETVKNYMEFEASAYEKFKNEDAMNLISLFPELKSDTLVQQQIEVYIENNKKIKDLKEEKIDLKKVKFELYFGT